MPKAKPALRVRATKSEAEDGSEILEQDDDLETSQVEEFTGDEVSDTDANELVRVSVFSRISPAPTVGNISLPLDLGIETLEKGVHSLPRCVAEVLVDRGIGAYV